MEGKQEIHIMPPDLLVKVGALALGALALWGAAQFIYTLKSYRFLGSGTTATNTISVTGEGEVFAVPDLATFSVSVEVEKKDVKTAQDEATKKVNDIIGYLKSAGVAEKDIKTASYNVSPQYDWIQSPCDARGYCPGGKQNLRGYIVSQMLEVKVRETDAAGEVLAGVGSRGATHVSGLSFTIDDEDALKAQARGDAIKDAEEKAEKLADQLGVTLVRIVGFSENGGGYYPPIAYMARDSKASMGGAMQESAPELPVGENKISSNVSITYEIR